MKNTNRFIKLIQIFWNSPEGCVSLLFDYSPYATLMNSILTYEVFPEETIKHFYLEITKAWNEIQGMNQISATEILVPTKIVFNKSGVIRFLIPLNIQENLINKAYMNKENNVETFYDSMKKLTSIMNL